MWSRRNHRAGTGDLRSVQEAVVRALAGRTPLEVRRGELDRGGRALRWVEAGRGGAAPVVLIAGSGTSSLGWAPVLPELAEHGRVVAYDRAGIGASDPVRGPGPTLESQVEDLAALVRHLGSSPGDPSGPADSAAPAVPDAPAVPAVLVGHSWGGQLAQLLARRRPELVAGLVLVDPAHEEFRPRAIAAAESVLNRIWLLQAALAPAGQAPESGAGAGAGADADSRAEAAVIALPHQRRTILAENRLGNATVPQQRRRRAAEPLPDVPVTVLSATEGLPRTMRARWTAMQAQITAGATWGEHIVVPGSGHAIHEDRPRAVIAAVLEVTDHLRNSRGTRPTDSPNIRTYEGC